MKVAMIASTYPRYAADGAGRFNHSIAEALAQLGHEVHVVIPHSPLIRPIDTPVEIHVFRYIWPLHLAIMGYAQAMHSDRKMKGMVPFLAPLFFIMAALKLWQVVEKNDVDVIHAHWVIPNGFIAAVISRLAGKPLFISLHGSDIFFARRNKVLGVLATWTFKHALGITACSPELYDEAVVLQAPLKRLHLLPWGADPALFNPPSDCVARVRLRLGLKPRQRILLGLGRLVGKKGFVNLIEAFALIEPQVSNACVVIVGDGPEKTSLQARVKALGLADKVILAGNVDWPDVSNYLALADVFVAPSIHDKGNVDGLPTVILEAMAAGKPIVASRIGGIPLVVKEGVNGFLVYENDVPALASCLSSLLISEEWMTTCGKMSRKLIEDRLNWRNVALSFIDMYCNRKLMLEET